MGKFIEWLGKAALFSTLDADSRYWQINIEDSNIDKKAFTMYNGLYQIVIVLFRLCNAPRTFQGTKDVTHFSVKWQFALIYFDDIVIFSRTPEQHVEHVRKALATKNSARPTLKLKKCNISTNNINYLGHVIRSRRLKLACHSTVAMRGLKPPTRISDLIFFLGLCNDLRIFIFNLHELNHRWINTWKKISLPPSHRLTANYWLLPATNPRALLQRIS